MKERPRQELEGKRLHAARGRVALRPAAGRSFRDVGLSPGVPLAGERGPVAELLELLDPTLELLDPLDRAGQRELQLVERGRERRRAGSTRSGAAGTGAAVPAVLSASRGRDGPSPRTGAGLARWRWRGTRAGPGATRSGIRPGGRRRRRLRSGRRRAGRGRLDVRGVGVTGTLARDDRGSDGRRPRRGRDRTDPAGSRSAPTLKRGRVESPSRTTPRMMVDSAPGCDRAGRSGRSAIGSAGRRAGRCGRPGRRPARAAGVSGITSPTSAPRPGAATVPGRRGTRRPRGAASDGLAAAQPGPRQDPDRPGAEAVEETRGRGDGLRSRGRAGGDGHRLEADPQDRPDRPGHGPGVARRSTAHRRSGWRSRNRYPARRAGRPRRRPPRPRRPHASGEAALATRRPTARGPRRDPSPTMAGRPCRGSPARPGSGPASRRGRRPPRHRCRPGRAPPGPGSTRRAAACPVHGTRSSPATCPGLTECPMPNGLPTTNTRPPSLGPSAAVRIGRTAFGETRSSVKPVCGSAATHSAACRRPR